MSAARFEGRNVVVTGAARGIGRVIVEAFLHEGARVLAVDVLERELEQARTRSEAPDRLETWSADVGDPALARGLVEEAVERLGRIHVLVNCAGVMPLGAFLDVPVETFDRTFAVNCRGPFVTMQAAGRHMVAHGGGAIVNIASANVFRNESPEAPYNASKAALVALTKALAHELGHLGVRANCVAPGETVTPEEEAELDEHGRRVVREYLRRIPLRRTGRPEEQAAAVLFLASDEASFVTGETIVVDGGELSGEWYDLADAPPVPGE